jgi:pimeloyl-ACP methyl ester carboxylesterase
MLLEARAPWEYAAGHAALPLLNRLPAGDGHPVIVFPGLGASDTSTAPLRRFLQSRGHATYGWGLGPNHGARAGVLDACRELVRQVVLRHGTPASLIGWSLGGIYARELAKQLPAQTRCVITLGTPFAGHPRANNATRIYETLSGRTARTDAAHVERLRRAPPVPTTSIYSKTDGVVAWQCSLNEDQPHTENVEIQASHIGMGVNPQTLFVIADRLRQDPSNWQRFDARAAGRALFSMLGQRKTRAAAR